MNGLQGGARRRRAEGGRWRRENVEEEKRERERKRKQGNLIVVSSRVGSSTSRCDTIEFYGVYHRVRGSLHVVQNLVDEFVSAFLRFYVSLARHYQTRKQIRESKRKINKAMFFYPRLITPSNKDGHRTRLKGARRPWSSADKALYSTNEKSHEIESQIPCRRDIKTTPGLGRALYPVQYWWVDATRPAPCNSRA